VNRSEGCTEDALWWAAKIGRMELEKRLREHHR